MRLDISKAFALNPAYATSIEGDIAKAMLAALWEAHDDDEPRERPQRQHTSAEAIVERQAEVRRLIDEGLTRQNVATHMGISYHSVRNDFAALLKAGLVTKDQGLSAPLRSAKAKARRPKVAKLHRLGMSNANIGREVGASATTISKDIILLLKSGVLEKRGVDII
jgi:DNA-binding NarL/FixJ family response regulator